MANRWVGLVMFAALVSSKAAWADPPKPPAHWDPLSWTVEGLALGGRTPLAGFGASVGRPFGTLTEGLTNTARGWVVTPGVDLTTARLFGPACVPVERLCQIEPFAFRFAVGPSLKFGPAEGDVSPDTGEAHAAMLVSLTMTAFAAFHRIDAGPLSPSSFFWDLIVRGRLGIMHPNHVFSLAVVLEGVLLNPIVRGVNLGLAVGVSY